MKEWVASVKEQAAEEFHKRDWIAKKKKIVKVSEFFSVMNSTERKGLKEGMVNWVTCKREVKYETV